MARNIEIKARISSIEDLMHRAAKIADQGPIHIAQDDTFFHCAAGRLKLRQFTEDSGELIFYQRADQSGPKESFYIRSVTAEPASLRECLMLAYGQSGRVIKHRTLFLAGRTRIHLDRVESLGDFLELEVVLADGDAVDGGRREAEAVMRQLEIEASQLIETAYVDLLAASSTSPRSCVRS